MRIRCNCNRQPARVVLAVDRAPETGDNADDNTNNIVPTHPVIMKPYDAVPTLQVELHAAISREYTTSIGRGRASGPCLRLGRLLLLLLGLVVLHRRLDGVLRQHAAVELHRGQLQVRRDVRVFDGEAFVQATAFHPFRRHGAANQKPNQATAQSVHGVGTRTGLVYAGETQMQYYCCALTLMRWQIRNRTS